jgi:hypothetical protein
MTVEGVKCTGAQRLRPERINANTHREAASDLSAIARRTTAEERRRIRDTARTKGL